MENFTVEVENMVFGGRCLSKNTEGKNLLVKGALPGETVEVKITASKKDYDEASVVSVVKASPNRVAPKCPKFGKCGGCSLQFADEEYQVQLRKSILFNTLQRNEIPVSIDDIECVTDSSWNYRNRFQFHFGGLMENESNKVVEFSDCPIAVQSVNNFFDKSNPALAEVKKSDRYFLFCDTDGNIKGESFTEKAQTKVVGKKNSKVKTGGKRKIFEGMNFDPNAAFCVDVCGKKINFDVRGFFQSNLKMLEKTVKILGENMKGTNLLDMYSGVGTFSVELSSNFQHCTLVEHNREAITFAEMNLAGIPHESFGLSGAKYISMYKESKNPRVFDSVIIDPPRSGMEYEVSKWLCENQDIVHVASLSCDPVTHARDLKNLIKSGYKIQKLYLLDYYPQTSHIESLAILERE